MSKRILIVEDDEATIRVLELALGQNGYQVAAAPSGHLAPGGSRYESPMSSSSIAIFGAKRTGRSFSTDIGP